jgi:general secretion pathway protein M
VKLSPLASRLIAWGLLANLCWALGAFVALPLLNQIRADKDATAESQELLARYRRLEGELPLLQAQFDQLAREVDSDRYFFAAKSPALAAAEMQNTLRGFLSTSGASLRGSRSLQPTIEMGFDRVGFDLDVTASAPQLSALLRAIAEAEPTVLVERMTAQVAENGTSSAAGDGQPSIAVGLRLVSYARRDPAGGKS